MLHAKGGVWLRLGGVAVWRNCRRTLVEQLNYVYGSPEQEKLNAAIANLLRTDTSVPSIVRRKKIYSGDEQHLKCPHNHHQLVARYYYCNRKHVMQAIETALEHKQDWRTMDCSDRANIWRKGADILAGAKRFDLNAALMLGQAKTCTQAEEDTCRLIKSMRRNADMLEELATTKVPGSGKSGVYASVQLRPLDGFVAAIGPFNMASLSANLALFPALMGNVVLWKPADACSLASYIIHTAMVEAGLPKGIVSFIPCNAKLFADVVTNSEHLAGINFVGRIENCHELWQECAFRMSQYRCIPRMVAECGGQNYHFVHETADVELVVDATIQAAFDYAGQKCTCCSRLFVPQSLWPAVKCGLQHAADALKVGDACDFNTNCSAVINEQTFDRLVEYLLHAQQNPNVDVLCGGDFCKTLGYFVEPTVVLCRDATDRLMTHQVLGPLLSVYVYENNDLEKMLQLISTTSVYAYTGSIFAADDNVICYALQKLRMTASNLYVNCKCTGSIDGNSPFSGNRLSSSYDNHGAAHSLLRWCAPQLIEENLPCGKKRK